MTEAQNRKDNLGAPTVEISVRLATANPTELETAPSA